MTINFDEIMSKKLTQIANNANSQKKKWAKYFDEPPAPIVTSKMLWKILNSQGGFCDHSKVFMVPFPETPYTISKERKNVREPYLERNICFIISVVYCCGRSGGVSFLEIKGEEVITTQILVSSTMFHVDGIRV
jgi:hypothetical protein